MTCVGCGGPQEPGFLEDNGENSSGYIRWIPGPLEKGFLGGAKRFGKVRVAVDAYRCMTCGLLSLYVGGSPQQTAAARRSTDHSVSGPKPPGPPGGGLTPPAPSPFAGS